jgi:hypothetical protein
VSMRYHFATPIVWHATPIVWHSTPIVCHSTLIVWHSTPIVWRGHRLALEEALLGTVCDRLQLGTSGSDAGELALAEAFEHELGVEFRWHVRLLLRDVIWSRRLSAANVSSAAMPAEEAAPPDSAATTSPAPAFSMLLTDARKWTTCTTADSQWRVPAVLAPIFARARAYFTAGCESSVSLSILVVLCAPLPYTHRLTVFPFFFLRLIQGV